MTVEVAQVLGLAPAQLEALAAALERMGLEQQPGRLQARELMVAALVLQGLAQRVEEARGRLALALAAQEP